MTARIGLHIARVPEASSDNPVPPEDCVRSVHHVGRSDRRRFSKRFASQTFPSTTGGGKPQIAEQGLPVDLQEHCGALQQWLMARLAEQVEGLLILRTHARPKACKRHHVKVRPMAETPLLEHPKTAHPGGEAYVRADNVLGMLPVADRWVGIVVHVAAAGGSHLVEPPIV